MAGRVEPVRGARCGGGEAACSPLLTVVATTLRHRTRPRLLPLMHVPTARPLVRVLLKIEEAHIPLSLGDAVQESSVAAIVFALIFVPPWAAIPPVRRGFVPTEGHSIRGFKMLGELVQKSMDIPGISCLFFSGPAVTFICGKESTGAVTGWWRRFGERIENATDITFAGRVGAGRPNRSGRGRPVLTNG